MIAVSEVFFGIARKDMLNYTEIVLKLLTKGMCGTAKNEN